MSSKLDPAIWSGDTGQWIPCCDRCQFDLNMDTCMLQSSWSMGAMLGTSSFSKLEPVIWSHDTGHIGIHGGVDVRLYGD